MEPITDLRLAYAISKLADFDYIPTLEFCAEVLEESNFDKECHALRDLVRLTEESIEGDGTLVAVAPFENDIVFGVASSRLENLVHLVTSRLWDAPRTREDAHRVAKELVAEILRTDPQILAFLCVNQEALFPVEKERDLIPF